MRLTVLLVALLLVTGSLALAADEISKTEFEAVLTGKCTVCHTRERIEEAWQRGDKIEEVLEKMLRFGVQLNERDRKVLGTFWGNPLK